MGWKIINYSGDSSVKEPSLRLKHMSSKSRLEFNNNNTAPLDWWAQIIIKEYHSKFWKLYHIYPSYVVGDGTGDVMVPFETEKIDFTSNVIPHSAQVGLVKWWGLLENPQNIGTECSGHHWWDIYLPTATYWQKGVNFKSSFRSFDGQLG